MTPIAAARPGKWVAEWREALDLGHLAKQEASGKLLFRGLGNASRAQPVVRAELSWPGLGPDQRPGIGWTTAPIILHQLTINTWRGAGSEKGCCSGSFDGKTTESLSSRGFWHLPALHTLRPAQLGLEVAKEKLSPDGSCLRRGWLASSTEMPDTGLVAFLRVTAVDCMR